MKTKCGRGREIAHKKGFSESVVEEIRKIRRAPGRRRPASGNRRRCHTALLADGSRNPSRWAFQTANGPEAPKLGIQHLTFDPKVARPFDGASEPEQRDLAPLSRR
jgi:hypothetical protein